VSSPTQTAAPPVEHVQRRVIGTLVSSQVLGGVGFASGLSVTAIIAEDVSGSTAYAGLANTFQVLGAAVIAIPMARVMAARGRRPGLFLGYTLALTGAALMIIATLTQNFVLLLTAALLLGGATASNNQARYAAADLSQPAHRGRDLSIVVWSTTVGAVLGPNLVGPGGALGEWLGMPRLAGPFVISLVGFALAMLVLMLRLRPDPLLEARRLAAIESPADPDTQAHGSITRGFRVIASNPTAALGLITVALGHTVMVSVMVMTPLHMRHGDAGLEIIGFVISIHILGMFAFSPLTGMATDRFGGRAVALTGSGIFVLATLLSANSPEGNSFGLMAGLFLIGLGWSCTLVSGSTLLVNALPVGERPGAQGASDLAMGIAAGAGGAVAGVVVSVFSFAVLSLMALAVGLVIAVAVLVVRQRVEPTGA
jgi:MFS family permease